MARLARRRRQGNDTSVRRRCARAGGNPRLRGRTCARTGALLRVCGARARGGPPRRGTRVRITVWRKFLSDRSLQDRSRRVSRGHGKEQDRRCGYVRKRRRASCHLLGEGASRAVLAPGCGIPRRGRRSVASHLARRPGRRARARTRGRRWVLGCGGRYGVSRRRACHARGDEDGGARARPACGRGSETVRTQQCSGEHGRSARSDRSGGR